MPLSPAADTNARYVYECLFELPDAVNDWPLWESSLKRSHTTSVSMFTEFPRAAWFVPKGGLSGGIPRQTTTEGGGLSGPS